MVYLHKFHASEMHGTIKQNRHNRYYIERKDKPWLAWANGEHHSGRWVPHLRGLDTSVKIVTFATFAGALSYCQEVGITIANSIL